MCEFLKWLETRPKIIQELGKKYPPGTKIITDDGNLFVVAYNEDNSLSVSRINPADYYDAAIETRFRICIDCIERFNQEETK